MTSAMDLIDALAPALDEGTAALAAAETRLADLTRMLTEIDTQMIPYHPGKSSPRDRLWTSSAQPS